MAPSAAAWPSGKFRYSCACSDAFLPRGKALETGRDSRSSFLQFPRGGKRGKVGDGRFALLDRCLLEQAGDHDGERLDVAKLLRRAVNPLPHGRQGEDARAMSTTSLRPPGRCQRKGGVR